jgi:sugar-specific transcriptional regulator TrmB
MTTKAIAQALAELETAEGRLTAEGVVKAARRKDSPLNAVFEWRDTKAAHQFRLDQARALIRSVRVEIKTETKVVRVVAYVRDPEEEAHTQGYRSTTQLARDREASHVALVNAFSLAAAHLRNAKELAAAFDLEDEVNILLESLATLRGSIPSGPPERPSH